MSFVLYMEQETINTIVHYLNTFAYPDNITEKDKKFLVKNASRFTIYKDKLHLLQPFETHCLKKILSKKEAKQAMIQSHFHSLGGHLAYANNLNKISQKYYWDGMNEYVFTFVKECPRYQEHGHKQLNEYAHPVPVPVAPFQQVGIDVKHVVPSQANYRYIIVTIDYLTKYIEVRALQQQTTAEIALFIYEEIISRHDCPKIMISDNGKPFVSALIGAVCKTFVIRHRTIAPYHSQSNGLVERINRTLNAIIKKRTPEEKRNWPDYLAATAFSYRSIKQATTKQSPFFLLYGYEPSTYFDNTVRPLDMKSPSFELQLLVRTTSKLIIWRLYVLKC